MSYGTINPLKVLKPCWYKAALEQLSRAIRVPQLLVRDHTVLTVEAGITLQLSLVCVRNGPNTTLNTKALDMRECLLYLKSWRQPSKRPEVFGFLKEEQGSKQYN